MVHPYVTQELFLLLILVEVYNCGTSICYSGAISLANFGGGTSTIWLSNVECTGSEHQLIDCPTSSGSAESCTHAQDAGVRCLAGMRLHWYLQVL